MPNLKKRKEGKHVVEIGILANPTAIELSGEPLQCFNAFSRELRCVHHHPNDRRDYDSDAEARDEYNAKATILVHC